MRDVCGLMRDVLNRLDDSHDAIRLSAVKAAQLLCPLLPAYEELDPSHSLVQQWLRLLALHAIDASTTSQLQRDTHTLHEQLTLYATCPQAG